MSQYSTRVAQQKENSNNSEDDDTIESQGALFNDLPLTMLAMLKKKNDMNIDIDNIN